MVIAVSTESGPEGLTIVKTAGSDAERLSLATEADMLRTAAHPGVVEVVDHTPDHLRIRHAGTTLTHLLPLPADHAAAVVCALADAVAAVHDAGVVHGQIDGDHVVLDRSGRPRLCGFGKASPVDEAGPDGAADDVASLGALFDRLLDEAAHVPWTPANAGARHRTRRKHAREVFRSVAGMAQRRDPRQRIAPHQMANAIRDALPTLELPSVPEPVVDDAGVPIPGVGDVPDDAGPLDDIEWSTRELEYLAGDAAADEMWEHDETPAADEPATDHDDVAVTDDATRTEPTPVAPTPPAAPVLDEEPRELVDESVDVAPITVAPSTAPRPANPVATTEEAPRDEATAAARDRLERALASGPPPITIRDSELPARRRRAPQTEEPEPRSPLVLLGIALFAVGVVLAPIAAWALGVFDGDDDTPEAADAAETESTSPDAEPQDPSTPSTWPETCDLPALSGPDVDGDGCPEPVTVNGRNVMVGAQPIAFGTDGDQVAVGDTDCDGVVTPYLLRPSTGQVFVWPQWPLDTEVQVRSSDQIEGATGIERRDGTTCDVIVVVGAGETVVAGTP